MKSGLFYASFFLIFFGAIAYTELKDSIDDKRHKRILKDGIYRAGKVQEIIELRRTGHNFPFYPWRVIVEFEYEGIIYSIKVKARTKPSCPIGSKVSVCVDKTDPWHSRPSL